MSRKAALLLAVFLLAALPALAASKRSDVKIINRSDWTIDHFFMSSSVEKEWGPDQLGQEVIAPGGTFTLQNIPCDTYDIKLIDEDGDECVVTEVDVCSGDQKWVINSEELAKCQGYGDGN